MILLYLLAEQPEFIMTVGKVILIWLDFCMQHFWQQRSWTHVASSWKINRFLSSKAAVSFLIFTRVKRLKISRLMLEDSRKKKMNALAGIMNGVKWSPWCCLLATHDHQHFRLFFKYFASSWAWKSVAGKIYEACYKLFCTKYGRCWTILAGHDHSH